MPLEPSDFPEDLQVAFFVFNLLSDRYSDASGIYLGKHWTDFPYFIQLYKISNPEFLIEILKMYEAMLINKSIEDYKARTEADERKNSAGKSNGINVKG